VRLPVQFAPSSAPGYATAEGFLVATADRIYTRRDQTVDHALQLAVDAGLVAKDASASQQLHALVAFANERLGAERDREVTIQAYRELAQDEGRRDAIYAANLLAFDDGIL
jgi:hypothetical protein